MHLSRGRKKGGKQYICTILEIFLKKILGAMDQKMYVTFFLNKKKSVFSSKNHPRAHLMKKSNSGTQFFVQNYRFTIHSCRKILRDL